MVWYVGLFYNKNLKENLYVLYIVCICNYWKIIVDYVDFDEWINIFCMYFVLLGVKMFMVF